MFCLFVPQLHVWDFRIYETTGQVKGHNGEVKWEARICKTKEMTGQCQMKGRKSSDRLSVDKSEWCVCWTSQHSEVLYITLFSATPAATHIAGGWNNPGPCWESITISLCYLCLLFKPFSQEKALAKCTVDNKKGDLGSSVPLKSV